MCLLRKLTQNLNPVAQGVSVAVHALFGGAQETFIGLSRGIATLNPES